MWKKLEYLEKLLDNANLDYEITNFIYKRLTILSEEETDAYIKYLRENQLLSLDETYSQMVWNEKRRV